MILCPKSLEFDNWIYKRFSDSNKFDLVDGMAMRSYPFNIALSTDFPLCLKPTMISLFLRNSIEFIFPFVSVQKFSKSYERIGLCASLILPK